MCESLETCKVCDESREFGLDTDSKCIECKSAENKFMRDGQCTACSQTGCKVCANLDTCKECEEKEINGYYLVGGQCMFCDSTNDNRFVVEG